PHEVVKAGDVVRVRVVEVDVPRKRIALTMRKDNADQPARTADRNSGPRHKPQGTKPAPKDNGQGGLAAALQAAMRGKS
ncbi:MAG: S1 RNA-binding domain-containing protein, partial [Loktanella sp.]|nr:S1 RNA-binding domain-containing protein [Loktanella sp.]